MVPQRKRVYLVLVGIAIILLLLHIQGRDLYVRTSRNRKAPWRAGLQPEKPSEQDGVVFAPSVENLHAQQATLSAADRRQWEEYKEQFPVKDFLQPPIGKPAPLPKVQYEFPEETEGEKNIRLKRRAAVKKAFKRCWSSYRKHAWMRDEVMPLSGDGNDMFGGWAATLMDSLDTLWIMDMKDEFQEAVGAAAEVDFSFGSSTQEMVNTFETNIRHLGGLLGAYDLSGDRRLLDKAVEVGNMLYASFDTPNRIPVTRWNPAVGQNGFVQHADEAVLAAEIGSFGLEFIRLTQLTGNPKWYDAAERITRKLHDAQMKTLLPGMFPLVFNGKASDFSKGGVFKLGAMIDSLYEYFPKMYALLGGTSGMLRDLYDTAARPAIKHTLFKPYTPDNADILIAGELFIGDDGKFHAHMRGEHLGCYAGGMFALGGKLTDNEHHVEAGRKLTHGCIWAYQHSPLGLMPEVFSMLPCPRTSACTWNEEQWKEAVKRQNEIPYEGEDLERTIKSMGITPGFTSVPDRRYVLRPEAIESVFILYRITGDRKLLDAAWYMFSAIERQTKTAKGNAALEDVMVSRDPQKEDRMESFWMAETLKYFYLIFSEPELISLDEYVLNTEAHPFKRPT